MTTEFTPGPWRVTADLKTNVIRQARTDGGFDDYIATTWGGEHEANARLIAAAPELLGALELIAKQSLEGSGSTGTAGWFGAIARVAIAKVTGAAA